MLEALPTDFGFYIKWSGILTAASLVLAILGFVLRWGVRFRLVGITGFMVVLTAGIFGLSLGLFERAEVPGALPYTVVFDNGSNRVTIVAKPPFSPSQLEATLQKAGLDLFSYGRLGRSREMLVRLRTIIHPEPGVSEPLYLGEARRALVRDGESNDDDGGVEVTIFRERLARLSDALGTESAGTEATTTPL